MSGFLVRAWRGLATGWQLAGATLLLLALLEGGTRVALALRDRARGVTQRSFTPGDPQEGLPWHAAYVREFDAVRAQRWQPYVYWRRAGGFRGRYVTVDDSGRRVTPQPTAGAVALEVWLFGGSTMWGTGQRDSATIAAEVARRLAPLAGPGRRIVVVNHGENGWVSTQSLLALQLALRAGGRPGVVLFYDGINDVAATVQRGEGGVPQNEFKREHEFALGRTVDHQVTFRDGGDDAAALAALAGEALNQSAFVRWVRTLAPRRASTFAPADSVAAWTVAAYAANAGMVELLGRAHGFVPLYAWQPTPQATPKRLTRFEARLLADGDKDPYWRRLREAHPLAAARWRDTMAHVAPERALDLSGAFAGDSLAVFTDRTGHTTEAAVPRIVDAIWPALERAVRAQLARPRG
jgi:lysophospholipase L1-like esterase